MTVWGGCTGDWALLSGAMSARRRGCYVAGKPRSLSRYCQSTCRQPAELRTDDVLSPVFACVTSKSIHTHRKGNRHGHSQGAMTLSVKCRRSAFFENPSFIKPTLCHSDTFPEHYTTNTSNKIHGIHFRLALVLTEHTSTCSVCIERPVCVHSSTGPNTTKTPTDRHTDTLRPGHAARAWHRRPRDSEVLRVSAGAPRDRPGSGES